ncbi:hypothetical protein F5Y15DRAFT_364582 [Xylariaceae sp. FL0016]|nr:hypothetical protein F5Y15DRAFT_364582 [Xylariaceae sp. FL0016]
MDFLRIFLAALVFSTTVRTSDAVYGCIFPSRLRTAMIPIVPARKLWRIPEARSIVDLQRDSFGEDALQLRRMVAIFGAYTLLKITDSSRLWNLRLAFDSRCAAQIQALLIASKGDFVIDSGARGKDDLAGNLNNPSSTGLFSFVVSAAIAKVASCWAHTGAFFDVIGNDELAGPTARSLEHGLELGNAITARVFEFDVRVIVRRIGRHV